ncbi:MAG: DNA repair protein RecN [Elusimicrobia bacterium]|nr:DNA repair protein RecN [Elusimicrobiota bacterium]
MLAEVAVKNFSLLDDLRWEIGRGLVALTGETGAGKSLLLDALGLALGRRADSGQVRRGTERLGVSARFEGLGPRVKALLREGGLRDEDDEVLLLRREIDASGKSKAFVNDRPVSVSTLARLGELLVYAHGQNEQQVLLRPAEQRRLLDGFGAMNGAAADVEEAFNQWREAQGQREALTLSDQERAQRLDLYRFQKKELDAARVRPDEEGEWEGLLPQLKNADRLKALARDAQAFLQSQELSATELVGKSQRVVAALIEGGAPLSETADLLNTASVALEEGAQRLETFSSGLESDPARLEEVLARLDLLGKLKRKYGPTLADVAAYLDRVTVELDRLENLESQFRDVEYRVAEAEQRWVQRAGVLSEGRQRAAKKLSASVQKELKEVGLPHARFLVEVETVPDQRASFGADQVRFVFSANPGVPVSALSNTASGGELSRVMLAIESVLARADDVPVLIFDEIDSGVGGSVGGVLGQKLAALGRGRQVLCVTHLATIAACADAHFIVEKEVEGDRTRVLVRSLSEADRPLEIARLFGSAPGAEVGVGLRHARELLAASRAK